MKANLYSGYIGGGRETFQFSGSNVMGYRRKLGSDITPPNIDFHSWQILLLRKNIQVRISNKRQ